MNERFLFTPRETPGVIIDRDTVIVTTNHLGADLNGDAGLDAQYMADHSGHPVVGLNRYGTGDDVRYNKALAENLTDSPEDVTLSWYESVAPLLNRQAHSRVELVGRSAGASLMLHVAALELIPETTGIMAIEVLRLQKINTRIGQLKYVHYQLKREGKFKDVINEQVDPDLLPTTDVRPEKAANTVAMIKRQAVDIRHYQHLWASDLPLQNALQIASRVSITASLLFAEESMAADSGKINKYLEMIKLARQKSAITEPLVAEVIPSTTHGSFDDQRLYTTHYRRFANLVKN